MFNREARFSNLIGAVTLAVVREGTSAATLSATRDALQENKLLTRRGKLKRWVGSRLRIDADAPVPESVQVGPEGSFANLLAQLEQHGPKMDNAQRKLVRHTITSVLMLRAAEKATARVGSRMDRLFRTPRK